MDLTNSNLLNNQYYLINIVVYLALLIEYIFCEYFTILILEKFYGYRVMEYLEIKYFKYKL